MRISDWSSDVCSSDLSDYPAVAKLEALGLAADFIVAAADDGVGVMKPSPAGLIHLMERAGASARSTILIGDRPERDGEAGRRAGVRTYIRSSRPVPGHTDRKSTRLNSSH